MNAPGLGARFESEIREQPAVWRRLATSGKSESLAAALGTNVLFVGSGSSLYAAELGALALRRRCIAAHALAATEARLDHRAYEGATVVAVSQSGRSSDLLEAIEILAPRRLVALTNAADSPLAQRAGIVIDVGAGPELAVPASKSVSSTVALVLQAASHLGGDASRNAGVLIETAAAIEAWFDSPGYADLAGAGRRVALARSVVVLGSDYGLPIARETALKLKEASYLHAEGFPAGEFRHGSIAMVDASVAVLGITDADAFPVVARPMRELAHTGASRFTIGCEIDDVPCLGPRVDEPFNTLAWLVTAQLLALHAGRARNVDGDAPRGLTKHL
jgi:glucosamine--fructose-6-phosphate aminotransferase (isomerizing)